MESDVRAPAEQMGTDASYVNYSELWYTLRDTLYGLGHEDLVVIMDSYHDDQIRFYRDQHRRLILER